MTNQREFIPDRSTGDAENKIEVLPPVPMNRETQAILELLIREIRNAEIRQLEEEEQYADAEAFDKVGKIIDALIKKRKSKEEINLLLIELLIQSERLKNITEIRALLKEYEKQYETLTEYHAKKFLSSNISPGEAKESESAVKIIYDRFPGNRKIVRIAVGVFYFPPTPLKEHTPRGIKKP